MKTLPCSYSGCSDRRVHHDRPYERRKHQSVQVPDDYTGEYQYCSMECMYYDSAKRKETDVGLDHKGDAIWPYSGQR